MRSLPLAFGAAVRRLRADAGFSQESFAAAAKISRTYMSEVERGVTVVSINTIGSIAAALGLPLAALMAHVEAELNGPKVKR